MTKLSRRHIALIVVWISGALGCSSERGAKNVDGNGDVTVDVSQPAATTARASSSARAVPHSDNWNLADLDGAAIGEPCADPQAWVCGRGNQVSIETSRRLSGPDSDLPCDTHPIGKSQSYEVSACTARDHLVAYRRCLVCRMDGATLVHVRLGLLSPKQAAEVMTMLNLTGAAPTSAEGWQRVVHEAQEKSRRECKCAREDPLCDCH